MSDIQHSPINLKHLRWQFADDPLIAAVAIETGCASIDRAEDLPESLRYLKDQLPGILFRHHPLGGAPVVPQFRPDSPVDDGPKYVFPKNSGSVISITPTMQSRLDADVTKSSRVLIVEGTKQMLFAAAYAPDDCIVVGIQGCTGWSHDGQALGVLDGLTSGRDMVIAFDADLSSNTDVYDAAERLNDHLDTIGANSVNWMRLSAVAAKKLGLDDYLAERDACIRSDVLSKLIAGAKPFRGRNGVKKPKRVSSAMTSVGDTFDYISDELGEVIEAVFESKDDEGRVRKEHEGLTPAGEVDGRRVRRVATLLRGAPRIIAIVEEKDDLSPGTETVIYHDIELQIGPKAQCQTYLIRDVPDRELHKVRIWLARAGGAGAFASLGPGGVGINGQSRIAECMRDLARNSEVEHRTVLLRTGWYQDGKDAYWVDNGGAHGDNEKITTTIAKLEGSVSGINVPGFTETYTIDDVKESVKVMLEVCNYLYDPTPWITGVSGILWAIAGGHPDAVLYFAGGAGSGKSSIIGAMASMLGPNWGTGMSPMASVEGTTAYLSDIAKQIHNCPLILDDARDRSSLKSQEAQDESIDAVIRVGYGGGGSARGRKVQDAFGTWKQSTANLNRPFVLIAGETLPDSSPQSTIERCLVVEIKASTSLKTAKDSADGWTGHEYLVWLSQNGALRPMLSHYIFQMIGAASMQLRHEGDHPVDSIEEIRERFEQARAYFADRALEKHWPKNIPVSERSRKVTGTFIAGASMMVEYFRELEMFTDVELVAIEDRWHQAIIAAAVGHTSTNLAERSESEAILATAVGAIASGKYSSGSPGPGQTCIGQDVTIRTDDGLIDGYAFNPKILSEVTRVNRKALGRRLSNMLIRGGDGRLERMANVNGTSMRCLVVRADAFAGFGEIVETSATDLEDF